MGTGRKPGIPWRIQYFRIRILNFKWPFKKRWRNQNPDPTGNLSYLFFLDGSTHAVSMVFSRTLDEILSLYTDMTDPSVKGRKLRSVRVRKLLTPDLEKAMVLAGGTLDFLERWLYSKFDKIYQVIIGYIFAPNHAFWHLETSWVDAFQAIIDSWDKSPPIITTSTGLFRRCGLTRISHIYFWDRRFEPWCRRSSPFDDESLY